MEAEATPAESGLSGKRSREETMDEGDEESSGNPRGALRTGLSDRFQETDLNAQRRWISANDTVLEDPAVLAQFIQDMRVSAEPPLGPTYGDIHETLGDTAAHGIIGSTRVAWHPSTKVGAPAGGGTLRQLNGVHRDSKVPLRCSIGTGAGVHQLEIFTQLPAVAIDNMKDFLVGKGWPVERVTAVMGPEIGGVQRSKSLRIEFALGQQLTYSLRVLLGNVQLPVMACMSGDGRIEERAKPIVHPVDHSKEAPARMYDLFTCTLQEVQGKTERECRELVVLWTHRMIEQDRAPFEVRAV
eukprot:861298-Prorocentrum_minimum.AAC.1